MTLEELKTAVEKDGADFSALITAYADAEKEGLISKNSELILKLKDAKAATVAKQTELDASVADKEKDMAPLELSVNKLTSDVKAMLERAEAGEAKAAEAESANTKAKIGQALRSAMVKLNMTDVTASDQVMIHAAEFAVDDTGGIVTTDGKGLTVDKWAADLKIARPDLWPASQGAGATGGNSGGNHKTNPWKAETRDYDAQTAIAKESPELASQMQAAAAA